ncbi:hypothetical protein [Ensifer sp. LCM 4579]|uniref:hypothetical protein n=1 Tax=Ensifer sp. LCM 4579 TaxID=1848292 RepID=UPI0008D8F725|nr:hypothetical protein [Ensifer sp. LCM 4579]OHV77832.1 hypothetical protein LCM4579_05565 [Ensifer sp. LCM 4579]
MLSIVISGSKLRISASRYGCVLWLCKETLDVAKDRFVLDRTRIASLRRKAALLDWMLCGGEPDKKPAA